MNTVRRMLIAAFAAAALISGATLADDANVAGEWDFEVQTQAGTGTPHFSLKQDGSAVTGTYRGQLGEAPVTGTVKGNQLTLNFNVNAQGLGLAITYSGTVEGDTIKGTLSLGELGDGTFTAKRS